MHCAVRTMWLCVVQTEDTEHDGGFVDPIAQQSSSSCGAYLMPLVCSPYERVVAYVQLQTTHG